MRTPNLWKRLYRAAYGGAEAVRRRGALHLVASDDVEDITASALLCFWEHTPESDQPEHQLRRAWHFGANAMRNHIRTQRGLQKLHQSLVVHIDPNSPRNLGEEAALCARQSLATLQQGLNPKDWRYLMDATEAHNQAAFARAQGVTRSAVTRRLQDIRARAHRLLTMRNDQ